MRIELATPQGFSFRRAVCSHGWFVLAPNRWDPATQTLATTIALSSERAVRVRIRGAAGRLRVEAVGFSDRSAVPLLRRAVGRMLRIEEDLSDFQERCRASAAHRAAAESGFGRLLRGATLFEDTVKVICTCNVGWRQTVGMVEKLTGRWGVPTADESSRAFPSAERLASASEVELKEVARVGYRSGFINRLARDVAEGRLDLSSFERFDGPTRELHRMLRQIHGIGDYGASNLCMFLGRYDCLAIDTEMMRLMRERHPRRRFTPASLRRYYETWRPYQFLAYWWELWSAYEARHGEAGVWDPERMSGQITTKDTSARGGAGGDKKIAGVEPPWRGPTPATTREGKRHGG